MRIGYLTFGRDDFGFGLALCIDELRQRLPDAEIIRATPTTARLFDVLLFSVFWWEHVWCLAAWLRAAGIEKKQPGRPRLVVGGFNTFNPVPLLAYADAVVCGDGELAIVDAVLGQDHPSIYDGTRQVVWATAPTVKPFAHVTNGIARIEAARGCKARCRFCQVAHLKPYREVDADRAMDLIDRLKVKRVSLFAPEPTQHTRDGELTERCRRRGITRVDSDVRLDRLRLREEAVPRVGIEGLSERLRRMVRKGYSDQQILEAVRQAIADGRKGLFMYLILDLPTEEDADWSAFRDLLIMIG